jgi:hypothetical protein
MGFTLIRGKCFALGTLFLAKWDALWRKRTGDISLGTYAFSRAKMRASKAAFFCIKLAIM